MHWLKLPTVYPTIYLPNKNFEYSYPLILLVFSCCDLTMFQVRLYEDFAKSQAKKGVDDCMTATAAPEQKKKGSTHVFQVGS